MESDSTMICHTNLETYCKNKYWKFVSLNFTDDYFIQNKMSLKIEIFTSNWEWSNFIENFIRCSHFIKFYLS